MSKEEFAIYVGWYIDTLVNHPREDTRDVLIDFLCDLKDFLTQEVDNE